MKIHATTNTTFRRIILAVISLLAAGALLLAMQEFLGSALGTPVLAQPDATTRYVAPTGSDPSNTCANSSTPCKTVQHAVDEAQPGDEVRVATGVYTGVQARAGITQVVYISKTVTVRGGYASTNWATSYPITQPTTLDARGLGRVLVITGAITPTVEGLRITGGDAAGLGGGHFEERDAGGGIYVVNGKPAFKNNWVFSNTTEWYGGGIFLFNSAAELRGNTITTNTADWGGGLHLAADSGAMLSDNAISANTATAGGGLAIDSSAAVLGNNVIKANTADWGGGLMISGPSRIATVDGNTIISNTAKHGGGGLYVNSSSPVLRRNTILSNTASHPNSTGGGLFIAQSSPVLINNLIARNSTGNKGSGLYIDDSSPHLLHTTIADNTGGDGSGIHVVDTNGPCVVVLTNTILASQMLGIYATSNNTVTLEGTLWHDNSSDTGGAGAILTGTINIHDDPAFVNPAAGDYHLSSDSLAIDAGVDAGVNTDIDGDPRLWPFDIGADEHAALCIHLPIALRVFP